ncbi:MAG TPA: alkaline phosphatase family protein, partial [Streptosporangiaceae bacterium]
LCPPTLRRFPVWTWLEAREVKRRSGQAADDFPGPLPRPDLPAGTDLLPQIRHIVVLMMENHSYDNYFGMLADRGEGFPLDQDGNPDVSNPRLDGSSVPANHRTSYHQLPEIPTQSWHACHRQWNGGRCDGFVRNVEELFPGVDPGVAMSYWTEEDLPFYYALARTFTLADHWFSSCLGPTFPNRRFLIAGTANGLIDDLPFDIIDYPPAGTIFDMLGLHGISWANYHHVSRYGAMLRRSLGGDMLTTARRLVSLGAWLKPLTQAFRGNKTFTADLYPLGLARFRLHLHGFRRFCADADNGTLPAFSIVDPDFREFSEENPQDVRRGEAFAAEVINRVMRGKGWPHTVLVWTYDEHGGYYDHVPPPEAPRPDDTDGRPMRGLPSWLHTGLRPIFHDYFTRAEAQDAGPRRYDKYGFRVPTVIVSPYSRPGRVCDQVFDHTSVLKLVEEKWNLPPLTRRDAAANSPLAALDLDSPPAFLTPPELPAPRLAGPSWQGRKSRRWRRASRP